MPLLEDPRHRGLRREDAMAGRYGTVRLRRLVGLETDRGTATSARPRSGSAKRPLAWTLGIRPSLRRHMSQAGFG
ncbi:hypothetical protein AQJ58_26180 [Streptomyces sp. DSM 15324]|nr:hypothetical protein AQJ58_26180 [Streptomyces sp. DSM 15324]